MLTRRVTVGSAGLSSDKDEVVLGRSRRRRMLVALVHSCKWTEVEKFSEPGRSLKSIMGI